MQTRSTFGGKLGTGLTAGREEPKVGASGVGVAPTFPESSMCPPSPQAMPHPSADPLHFGVDAAACLAKADLARCPEIQAHWRLAALEIARLGGAALLAPPAQLIGTEGDLHEAWTRGHTKATAARLRDQTPRLVTWDNDRDALFPIYDLDAMSDEALLALAADHFVDANNMVDGTEMYAQESIDLGQDTIEQAVMTLVTARGWTHTDPRLAPYLRFARQAVPRLPEPDERDRPEHLARMARRAHRQAELFQLGETWRLFPQHLESKACEGVLVVLSLALTRKMTAEELESLPSVRAVQALSPTDHFAVHYLTRRGHADIGQCSVHVPMAPSTAQRDAVLALLRDPNVRERGAHIEPRYLFEGEVAVSAFSRVDRDTTVSSLASE
jgi:hypothetical protein